MESDPHAPLLASEGTTFSGLVAQVPTGWRASGVLQRRRTGGELEEQIVGPKIFASKDAAQAWLREVGSAHGFLSIDVVVHLLSEPEQKTESRPGDKDGRGGTIWDR